MSIEKSKCDLPEGRGTKGKLLRFTDEEMLITTYFFPMKKHYKSLICGARTPKKVLELDYPPNRLKRIQ